LLPRAIGGEVGTEGPIIVGGDGGNSAIRRCPFSSQTSVTAITDSQPAVRDNEDVIGQGEVCPSPETALEAARKPSPPLFENRKLRRLADACPPPKF